MTRKRWAVAAGAGAALLTFLLLESREPVGMKMTSVEKHFVNSPGHAAHVARGAESLLDRIEIEPGWRYLDVGCGVGAAAKAIAEQRPLSVTGVDVDPDQIAAANAADDLPNLKFAVMDSTRLDFADDALDIVATSKTTHHIPNYERALAEMVRVLRPGGYLIYTDFAVPEWLTSIGRRLSPFAGLSSEAALDRFAARAGLEELFRSRRFALLDKIWRKPLSH